MSLLLLAIAIIAASGIPGLLLSRRWALGQYISVLLATAGSLLGMATTYRWLLRGGVEELSRPWTLPGGSFHVAIDGISAVFLLPVFLVSMLGSIYGLGYWKQSEHPENGRKLRLFYGFVTAGMAMLLISRNTILFLFGWEVMAISAYFLVITEDEDAVVREAGWIYFVCTHICTLGLFALFVLMQKVNGNFELVALPETIGSNMATTIFLLALVSFGFKAGIMPLHVWLPSAHANAPSHVSALMSGVIIKMGIYGLVRVTSLLPHPPVWWGGLLLALGVASGILGMAFAIGQRDLKRVLAYSSIENIGIIVIGLGLAMVGRSMDRPIWVALGLGGALLHVWNHALFKPLLFMTAGSVIHAVHTRDVEVLGGLAKTMPRTACCFLVGAVAICGLPPLNGFVSELLIYVGLLGTLLDGKTLFEGVVFVAPALAMIGALAVACFVRVFGIVFLGAPRSPHAQHAHESPVMMVVPMVILVVCCFGVGLASWRVVPLLEPAIAAWLPAAAAQPLVSLVPLSWVSGVGIALVLAIGLAAALLIWRMSERRVDSGLTWDCGYAAPSVTMQYTSSSFSELLVGLFGWALRTKVHTPAIQELFPSSASFSSHVPEVVLDEVVMPASRMTATVMSWFRWIQHGSLQSYLMYILAILFILMLWR
jgi:hydrogenase-4 component B